MNIEIDDCLVCVHGLYETDRATFCPECVDHSNFEFTTDDDMEFLAGEYHIEPLQEYADTEDSELDDFQEGLHQVLIDKLISGPVA